MWEFRNNRESALVHSQIQVMEMRELWSFYEFYVHRLEGMDAQMEGNHLF